MICGLVLQKAALCVILCLCVDIYAHARMVDPDVRNGLVTMLLLLSSGSIKIVFPELVA